MGKNLMIFPITANHLIYILTQFPQILDEVFRILSYIALTQPLGRAYKVTDELFDLSTMAMEYFKEHIEPTLPEISYFGAEFLDFATPFASKLYHTLPLIVEK